MHTAINSRSPGALRPAIQQYEQLDLAETSVVCSCLLEEAKQILDEEEQKDVARSRILDAFHAQLEAGIRDRDARSLRTILGLGAPDGVQASLVKDARRVVAEECLRAVAQSGNADILQRAVQLSEEWGA